MTRSSHRLPLVFFVVSELKHRSSSSCFHCTQKFCLLKWFLNTKLRILAPRKLGMVAPQDKSSKEMKSSKKMKFASSSAETEQPARQQSLMIQRLVESSTCGQEMVPNPQGYKGADWEAVDMAFVVGQGGKNSVLASAAKKWKDFKSTLTRHYILPYTNDKEKLSQPPETYKFIEKAQWDAFVASRLSKDFESVHSQHAQIREKLEYNHRLSRKGYAGLEDQLEETMPGVEIDRSTLWKRARQDKHGNIPDPKVAEKAKLIDELQNKSRKAKSRVSFDDRLKDSLRVLLQEETKKMEAKAREEALRMEARTKQLVEAEREHFLSQLSQLIPNFDPSMLKQELAKVPKIQCLTKLAALERRKKKKDEEKEEEKEKEDEEKHDDKVIEVGDYSNMEAPSSLKTLCRYVETTLLPEDKILQFTIDKEVFWCERDTFLLPEDITQFAGMEEIGATVVAVYMRYLHDVLKQANMCSMVGFIDPATVSANSGTIADRSRLPSLDLADCKSKEETVYFLDPLPGHRVVDEEAKNIVNSAIKIYNSHIARAGRKNVIWKTLSGTPKQPSSVECGYYVMRFMRDIIMDPSLGLRISMPRETRKLHTQEAIDEVRNEWAEFVCQIIKRELLNT
ncbi:hypothetical protein Prudu_001584 [Prunus dulcis]|uniref:Ubiquitin-like protease family profile domain-containing protein n=1 Tax=Prunus dulcis TaxID=3755 RepID=A0A4Y1QNZ6_PRUDU|nr:hypothetical protein Prudu_001584 [Prunus dulcis]